MAIQRNQNPPDRRANLAGQPLRTVITGLAGEDEHYREICDRLKRLTEIMVREAAGLIRQNPDLKGQEQLNPATDAAGELAQFRSLIGKRLRNLRDRYRDQQIPAQVEPLALKTLADVDELGGMLKLALTRLNDAQRRLIGEGDF